MKSHNFYSDEGLVVPSITYELRNCLFKSAEKLGFKSERIIEMVGRSACEMVLTLIGGSNRYLYTSRIDPGSSSALPIELKVISYSVSRRNTNIDTGDML